MGCEKVIGKLKDVGIAGKTVEYVDIEWHEEMCIIDRPKLALWEFKISRCLCFPCLLCFSVLSLSLIHI